MWKKLKILTFIDFETRIQKNERSIGLGLIQEIGIDFLMLVIVYSTHSSLWFLLLRRLGYLRKVNRDLTVAENERIQESEEILENLSPEYVKITMTGVNRHIKLTPKGKQFIKPTTFINEVLKEYGHILSFISGSVFLGLFKYFLKLVNYLIK